ncbi:MAG: penicillin acylase family protein, partial [Ketobacteraceae bacterium]|nr:penicillin acylase family protein [Ketobacteraceae bacterium]
MGKLPGKRRLAMFSRVLRHILQRDSLVMPAPFNGAALSPARGRLEFVRDQNGVAHIYADVESDLFLAVGYLQGRERFVLLELLRHLGQGRLSELVLDVRLPNDIDWFGGIQLSDVDAFVLPLGFAQEAKRDLYRLPLKLQQNIKAFTRGINAALEEMRGVYPPEFLFLGDVSPWQPEDCLLLARTCGFVIGLLPLENELTFDNVRAEEGDEIARLLYPEAPWHEAPDVCPGGSASMPEGPLDPPNMGSNNWAVSGARTESGAPLVCNDPHVPLIPGPTYWHHVHLHCGDLNVQGGLFPGFPAFGFGHNEAMAWGVTTAFRDSWDLFRIHRVRGKQPCYRVEKGTAPIYTHQAELKRRLRGTRSITWESCDHGIIYPDWQHQDGTGLALKYAGCDLAAFCEGHRALMQANTNEQVQHALSLINEGPFDFNVVYGLKDGDIAWQQVGRLPARQTNGLFVRDAHSPGA